MIPMFQMTIASIFRAKIEAARFFEMFVSY
jgi:hypothetical protein